MKQSDLDRLRSIKTFPSLVKYLRDELDWPIDSDDYDDLTFDYQPEELGLDSQTAVKIKEIKQLRPLNSKQPWGIFFINFEPKRLPVVVLRRILRSLVIKKRQSANRAQQAAWNLHDLLFISSYGEAIERSITFAHFSEDSNAGELPTLRVLGWDNQNTVLHLDHAHTTLKEKLVWPDDPDNLESWRKKWSEAFTLKHREVITTSKELAIRLAALATQVRNRVNAVLRVESEKGQFRQLHQAFREALIHNLEEDDFADMYAQTITYGLLAARVSRPMGVVTENLAQLVSNPFLKETLSTFLTFGGKKGKIDFDEVGILDVVDLLNSPDTNIEAILRDFGNRTQREDPVIHFYESFLSEYDKKKKVERGVFYTPQPVVSYIVRSVHELLQTEFGLEDGLGSTVTWGEMAKRLRASHSERSEESESETLRSAQGDKRREFEIPKGVSPDEPFVQVLDPAVGTGTFLVEVIDVIAKTMIDKWEKAGRTQKEISNLWDEYVGKHLLPRLYGYELMMAPYVIADIKLTLKLAEISRQLGELFYHAEGKGRFNIYLTNSLEPPSQVADEKLADLFLPLAHEANEVNKVKREKRFTVVIGNPPYSNFGQLNRIPFILDLLIDYKKGLNEKKLNLDDDFIKFIRLSQYTLESTGFGLFGMITNNTFFDGITHRQMRRALMATFRRIRLLNLHGSMSKKELTPDKTIDENVFDIQQGVGISLFSLLPEGKNEILHADLWGTRERKYSQLDQSQATFIRDAINPQPQYFFFVPKDFDLKPEYDDGVSLSDMYVVQQNGIKTDRDELFFDEDTKELQKRIRKLYSDEGILPDFRAAYNIENSSSYDLLTRRKRTTYSVRNVHRCLYRPFDEQWLYYAPGITSRPAWEVMQHMIGGKNLALISMRQYEYRVPSYCYFFLTDKLVECRVFVSNRGIANVFPLYVYDEGATDSGDGRRPNLHPSFLKSLSGKLNLTTSGPYQLPKDIGPEDIFNYSYAIFHSPTYRDRYAEFLKIEFPRLPITSSLDLFRALAELGHELVALHLMESPKLENHITRFVGKEPEVEKVTYSNNTVWIDKAQTTGFKGVPENVWEFHIGGYKVCEKWLKDRKGRTLSKEDIEHYHRIVVALNETIRLMAEIDRVIDEHGGWPIK